MAIAFYLNGLTEWDAPRKLIIMRNGAWIQSFMHITFSLWKWQPDENVELEILIIPPPMVNSGF